MGMIEKLTFDRTQARRTCGHVSIGDKDIAYTTNTHISSNARVIVLRSHLLLRVGLLGFCRFRSYFPILEVQQRLFIYAVHVRNIRQYFDVNLGLAILYDSTEIDFYFVLLLGTP